MAAPYTTGQTLAWLQPDPDGIRVHRATVLSIDRNGDPGSWTITTDRGISIIDHAGTGHHAVPLDADIETELYVRGDGYLVQHSFIELDRTHTHDHDLDLGDDLDVQ